VSPNRQEPVSLAWRQTQDHGAQCNQPSLSHSPSRVLRSQQTIITIEPGAHESGAACHSLHHLAWQSAVPVAARRRLPLHLNRTSLARTYHTPLSHTLIARTYQRSDRVVSAVEVASASQNAWPQLGPPGVAKAGGEGDGLGARRSHERMRGVRLEDSRVTLLADLADAEEPLRLGLAFERSRAAAEEAVEKAVEGVCH